MQCGYCTPGMILSGVALLRRNPNPGELEIVRAMEGNICRCGTYPRILAAFRIAAQAMRDGGQPTQGGILREIPGEKRASAQPGGEG